MNALLGPRVREHQVAKMKKSFIFIIGCFFLISGPSLLYLIGLSARQGEPEGCIGVHGDRWSGAQNAVKNPSGSLYLPIKCVSGEASAGDGRSVSAQPMMGQNARQRCCGSDQSDGYLNVYIFLYVIVVGSTWAWAPLLYWRGPNVPVHAPA